MNARLIDARSDDHRWAESCRRDLSAENLFAVQAELTKRIARSLQAELSSFETTPSGSFDRAVVHAALGEEEEALGALRKAPLTDHYVRTFLFRYAPVFDPLRDTPGYRELIREVNRAWGLNPDGSLPDSVDVSFRPPSDE